MPDATGVSQMQPCSEKLPYTEAPVDGANGTTTSIDFAAVQHVALVKLQGGATGTITFQVQQPDRPSFRP